MPCLLNYATREFSPALPKGLPAPAAESTAEFSSVGAEGISAQHAPPPRPYPVPSPFQPRPVLSSPGFGHSRQLSRGPAHHSTAAPHSSSAPRTGLSTIVLSPNISEDTAPMRKSHQQIGGKRERVHNAAGRNREAGWAHGMGDCSRKSGSRAGHVHGSARSRWCLTRTKP